jgi:hypothetical protein
LSILYSINFLLLPIIVFPCVDSAERFADVSIYGRQVIPLSLPMAGRKEITDLNPWQYNLM